MPRGRFITFEGGEGCGKSTQIAKLRERLEAEGVDVVVVREPGGTWLSEQIRRLIKDQEDDAPCDRAELLLFLAARAQLVRNVILPALESGAWVVSDRFCDSTLAYQGYGRGLPLDFISSANDFACGGLMPDMTLLLDVEPSVARERVMARAASRNSSPDRFEREDGAFHARLRHGFEELAKSQPERIRTIDANGTAEDVACAVWEACRGIKGE